MTTTIEVRADEPTVRVDHASSTRPATTACGSTSRCPEPATESEAECAFATVTRGLTAEGRPDELGLPTFPSRRFVRAGGLTVVHDGVAEYELVDITGDGDTQPAEPVPAMAGIARPRWPSPCCGPPGCCPGSAWPTGRSPPVRSPRSTGSSCVGRRIEARYAVAVGDVDPWALADDVLLPLEVVGSLGGGWRPAEGSALEVDGAEVTAVRRVAGLLEVRALQPVGRDDDRDPRRPRPAGSSTCGAAARALRRPLRATALRHRHRPLQRRVGTGRLSGE